MADKPFVSIIIPTYNGEIYLEKVLLSVRRQTFKNFELIIIDSSSTDRTIEIANKYADRIILIPKEEFDHGGTRTKAGKLSNGSILVYLTQDCVMEDETTLEKLLNVFEDSKIGAAYGRQIPYEYTNIFGKHLREFNYPEKSNIRCKSDIVNYGIKTAFLSNSFCAYRRSALDNVGWFKDGLIIAEDMYVGAKLILDGYCIAYVADALVYHSHSYTPLQEFKRYFDIGVMHTMEKWIIENFGKAEGEGLKYIISGIKYLKEKNSYHLIPEFLFRSLLKFIGYNLGKKYTFIPKRIIKTLSMNKDWWKDNLKDEKLG